MIIIDKPERNIHLTEDEYNRLLQEYREAYMFYAGTPPSFETFAEQRKGLIEHGNERV